MNKFKIGDMCEIVLLVDDTTGMNGEEVMVIALPGKWLTAPDHYEVEDKTGKTWIILEKYLKLIPPEPFRGDMDTIISWDDCVWKPKELVME